MPRDINDNQPGLTQKQKEAANPPSERLASDNRYSLEYGGGQYAQSVANNRPFQIS